MSSASSMARGVLSDQLDPRSFAEVPKPEPFLVERVGIDESCRRPLVFWYASAVFWLMLGTAFALLASFKLHSPWVLANTPWLTFGRVRPAHLSAVAFGWGGMAGLATSVWLMCRLCRVPLRYPVIITLAGVIWNIGMVIGIVAVLSGYSTGIEWIEFPSGAAFLLFCSFAIVGLWAMITFGQRQAGHVYVSQWYIFGGIFWFPWLYASVYLLHHLAPVRGVTQAAINWWFGHNALGLFFSPVGIAAIYYLIPKVVGRPIYSYHLSILGFWALALFYNWAGAHHLVGGPIPAWLVTVSTVGSVMMVIPVLATALNHHMSTYKSFRVLRYSPTLRFVVFGALCYTAVSLQGSLMSIKVMNEPFHFTHHTVAHAHLGLYGFFTMAMFGAMYYIIPRLTGREWASSKLIRVHFWACSLGITAYFVLLTIGGMEQGFELNQAKAGLWSYIRDKGYWDGVLAFFHDFKAKQGTVPFMEVTRNTVPWLWTRSISGIGIAVGHIAFFALMVLNLHGLGRKRVGPTLFKDDPDGYDRAFGTEPSEQYWRENE